MSSGESRGVTPELDELPDLTAGQIVDAMAAADRTRFSSLLKVLMRRFEPMLHWIWARVDGNPSEFDDFRQGVWIKLLRDLSALRESAAFPGFFRQVALNHARDQLKIAHRRGAMFVPLNEDDETHDIPTHDVDAIDHAILVQSYLGALPPTERAVLKYLFIHEFSTQEVAKILGITEGAVRTTKSRGINRLRTLVTAELRKTAQKTGR
jgi:RNA polymerase sigma factor (sigma-70 family)